MDVKAFIRYLLENDRVCALYLDRIKAAGSKSAIAEMVCDCNGGVFVCSEIAAGAELDYESAAQYFAAHFNGKRVFEYENEYGRYTSETYCAYSGEIVAKTTVITLLGCDVTIVVPDGAICNINCDSHSHCKIVCKGNSRAICTYWGNKPEWEGCVKFLEGE